MLPSMIHKYKWQLLETAPQYQDKTLFIALLSAFPLWGTLTKYTHISSELQLSLVEAQCSVDEILFILPQVS